MCGREELREDRALGMGQAVKDVKWGSTLGNWHLRCFRRGRGKSKTNRCSCSSNKVYRSCLYSSVLNLGNKTAWPFKGFSGTHDNLKGSVSRCSVRKQLSHMGRGAGQPACMWCAVSWGWGARGR